ncbi:MAG: hypothetical protein H6978_08370 [Gammaproteobacteria bacterium]|nr:hypothetical protein [Gammaproteobacteria bacterium]
MADTKSPFEVTPPAAGSLIKAVLAAIVGAAVLLVVVVLPAEYNIDPTGLGGALGLTSLRGGGSGEGGAGGGTVSFAAGTAMSLEGVEAAGGMNDPVPLPNTAVHQSHTAPFQKRTIEIVMAPNEELEYKAIMQQDQVMLYHWRADRGDLYFDFHADSPEAPEGFWVRYEEGDGVAESQGSLVAPFNGNHGWFWLNYNEFPVTITLDVEGYFDDIVELGRSVIPQ